MAGERGTFIALEGPDGGGKTTQVERLATWLREQGHEVVKCREPGGTHLGSCVRELLLLRNGPGIGMTAEMLLFMAARAQLVEEVIAPAMDAGKVVVADRYLLSSLVYQGVAGGLDVFDVARVGRIACREVMPDLTLVLDIPQDVARARLGAARDRIEGRSPEYHEKVRQGFLDVRRATTDLYFAYATAPSWVIDGTGPPDEVEAEIKSYTTLLILANQSSRPAGPRNR